jgi:uncharacterized circularly permuted ATP-grasp superfamily protein
LESHAFDEMHAADGSIRRPYEVFEEYLRSFPPEQLQKKRAEADHLFRRMGITFLVYFEGGSAERLIPFDILPRILARREWQRLEQGCVQRVKALNMFLHDIYHDREVCKAGVMPEERILRNSAYRPEAHGIDLPFGVYAHIAGIDVVRVAEDEFYVLEDNLRTPSGVSYMLENREVMMRLFPEAFARQAIAPVDNYCDKLLRSLRSVAPPGRDDPSVVLLTPGRFNSAYFEHVFLAEQMGIELVEGQDLFVDGGKPSSWWRARTCSSTAASSTCARPRGRGGSTSSTGGSTTISSIRLPSAPIPPSACQASSRWSARAG